MLGEGTPQSQDPNRTEQGMRGTPLGVTTTVCPHSVDMGKHPWRETLNTEEKEQDDRKQGNEEKVEKLRIVSVNTQGPYGVRRAIDAFTMKLPGERETPGPRGEEAEVGTQWT